ncbi:MAG: excinuclease ABC subunit UvrC [Deferribacteraceae bacterium]|jgi:excinuclease ABC subunit C|nr:excinuclease ABC subunit UvrC [Deferribacteraceae bacterium]
MFKINLSDISASPGIYLFLGKNERILYVGKAKSLRQRLASYFNAQKKSLKTEKMLTAAQGLRTIITKNEVEAFLLESNLIKTEQPKYNVLLKDSKGYPYVKLTNEEYPRLIYTHQTDDPKSLYFGPFVNAGELKVILEFLKDAFPLRTCSMQEFNKGKICLKYQIHKCPGPCEKFITKDEYDKFTGEVKKFFSGDTEEVQKQLKERMEWYAVNMLYEYAAFYRDRLAAIDTLFARQRAVKTGDERNLDLFYRHELRGATGVTSLFVRGGRLIGVKTHFFSPDENDLLERFIMQFYSNVRQFPELIVAEGDEVSDAIAEAVSSMAGKKVTVRKRGYADLIALAASNAEHATEEYLLKAAANKDLFPRLVKIADKNSIYRVECIDISHLGGDNTVGVSVVSEDGIFIKKEYRKYKIKSAGNNDVQAIKELMSRKMTNVSDGSESASDLYIIDGGVSQLNAAVSALRSAGSDSACLSISKSRSLRNIKHETPESIEEIHEYGRKNPLKFRKNDPALLFMQKMRDEAHRFAIKYSRALSLKKRHISPLLTIKGVGEKRAKAILQAMPDLYSRNELTPEMIRAETKVPMDLAEKIAAFVKTVI